MRVVVVGCNGYQGYVVAVAEAIKDLVPEIEMSLILERDIIHNLDVLRKRVPYSSKILMEQTSTTRLLLRIYRELDKHSFTIIGCPWIARYLGLLRGLKRLTNVFIEAGHTFTPLYDVSHIKDPLLLHWMEQKAVYGNKGVVVGPFYEKPLYSPCSTSSIVFITTRINNIPKQVVEETNKLVNRIEIYSLNTINSIQHTSEKINIDRSISCADLVVTDDPYIALYSSQAYGKKVFFLCVEGFCRRTDINILSSKIGFKVLYINKLVNNTDSLIRGIKGCLLNNYCVKRYPNMAKKLAKKLLDIMFL